MIETEENQLLNQMKKDGIDFLLKTSLPKNQYLCVEVDIDCPFNLVMLNDQLLTRTVHRGSKYYVSFEENERNNLTMKIGTNIPKDYCDIYFESFMHQTRNSVRATTFADLCWIHSEGSKNEDIELAYTEPRENIILGDLTNVLPSKFVDDFVEMIHIFNQNIFDGLFRDAIIYGPFVFSKEQFLSKLKYNEQDVLI